ncbi:MAG: hypothetical protein AAGF11_28330 [Myxococcota bacterium]
MLTPEEQAEVDQRLVEERAAVDLILREERISAEVGRQLDEDRERRRKAAWLPKAEADAKRFLRALAVLSLLSLVFFEIDGSDDVLPVGVMVGFAALLWWLSGRVDMSHHLD